MGAQLVGMFATSCVSATVAIITTVPFDFDFYSYCHCYRYCDCQSNLNSDNKHNDGHNNDNDKATFQLTQQKPLTDSQQTGEVM